MRRILLLLSLGFFCTVVAAEERVAVCYNYGCYRTDVVVFSEAQLAGIHELLSTAKSAEQERKVLALAVGRLLGWAGQQTPISADRGGNVEDAGVFGRMDCIVALASGDGAGAADSLPDFRPLVGGHRGTHFVHALCGG